MLGEAEPPRAPAPGVTEVGLIASASAPSVADSEIFGDDAPAPDEDQKAPVLGPLGRTDDASILLGEVEPPSGEASAAAVHAVLAPMVASAAAAATEQDAPLEPPPGGCW